MKNNDFEDDGRTIADMSEVGPKIFKNKFKSDNPEQLRGKNLLAFIGGSMLASLLIGLVYIVVFGLVILIMYLVFKNQLS